MLVTGTLDHDLLAQLDDAIAATRRNAMIARQEGRTDDAERFRRTRRALTRGRDDVASGRTRPTDVFRRPHAESWSEFVQASTKISDVYLYHDAVGRPAYFCLRSVAPGKAKGKWFLYVDSTGQAMRPRDLRPRYLYRLPHVLDAVADGVPLTLCEGERDADAAAAQGIAATCTVGGAVEMMDADLDWLQGAALVVIVPDNDWPGEIHARHAERLLTRRKIPTRILPLPRGEEHTDLADLIQRGETPSDLLTYYD